VPAPVLLPAEAKRLPDPRICPGKLPHSWSGVFRPPVGQVCACCGGSRFWGPAIDGWLWWVCHAPFPGDEIREAAGTNG